MKRVYRILRYTLVFMAIALAGLALTEIAMRALGWMLAERITPDACRSDLVDADRLIACFGASYVQGVGATDASGSFPTQLEAILNMRQPQMTTRVLNEGRAGYNSSDILEYMRERLPEYPRPPELIVVEGFINNVWNLHGCSALIEGYAELPDDKRWLDRLSRTRIGRLILLLHSGNRPFSRQVADLDERTWFDIQGDQPQEVLDPKNPQEYEFLRAWLLIDIQRMAELADSQGSALVLALPTNSELNGLVRECAIELGLWLCDQPKNESLWRHYGWISRDGWHPNERGYAVYAEHIADCIDRLMPLYPPSAQGVAQPGVQPAQSGRHVDRSI